jgi:glucose/arabinose dehydrogenase
MRLPPASPLALAAVCLACACGGSPSAIDADPGRDDAGAIDAPRPRPDADLSCDPVDGAPALRLVEAASGFSMPVYVTSPPGDPRLFVVEKGGRIKIVDDGVVLPTPFLQVSTTTSSLSDERGLLGLAFHPRYAENRKFYVFYTTAGASDTRVDQYLVSATDRDRADDASAQQVFFLDDFAGNHNGGTIQFGPDGYLYIGIGDGGNANDPRDYGQDLGVHFGKILRIDVDSLPYTIPADNPFAGATPGEDEIWSYGWRNPWRWSFDRDTGDMYVGDVGQNQWEEIDVEPAGAGGRDYGWDDWEGTHCFTDTVGQPPSDCESPNTQPVYEYGHNAGCTVIGGYVYRGCKMPGHHGTYFFADYCSSWVRSFEWDGAGGYTNLQSWPSLAGGDIVSFGEDFQGELYIVRQDSGQIMKIVPQ